MEGLGMGNDELQAFEGMPVTPESGWLLHTLHGIARCGEGPDDYLVRLADVVRWFMKKRGLPLAVAVDRVLEGITPESFQHMFSLDSFEFARPMWERSPWDEFSMSPEEKAMPYLEGRVSGLVKRLRASWLMPDFELDKLVNSGIPPGEPLEFDSQHESAFDFSDRKNGGAAAFAIRMSAANTVWGWGSVAAAVAQPAAVPSATAAPGIQTQDIAPAIGPQDVTDWPSLVQYRQQFVGVPPQQRPAWLLEYVAILARWVRDECAAGRSYGVLDRAGKALGFTNGVRVRQLLKDHGFDAAGQEVALSAGNPWGGLGNKRRHSA